MDGSERVCVYSGFTSNDVCFNLSEYNKRCDSCTFRAAKFHKFCVPLSFSANNSHSTTQEKTPDDALRTYGKLFHNHIKYFHIHQLFSQTNTIQLLHQVNSYTTVILRWQSNIQIVFKLLFLARKSEQFKLVEKSAREHTHFRVFASIQL